MSTASDVSATRGGDDFIVSRLFYNPTVRALFSQCLLVALVVWLGFEIVGNASRNLEERNIASGFGFLSDNAGFGILQTLIPYEETSSYGRAFVVGLLNTILISFLGILAATALGFVVGIMRLSRNWCVARIASAYVETIRNIPLLLQIFIWYNAVLKPLPGPRDSISVLGGGWLSNRGLIMPRPMFDGWSFEASVLGVVAAVAIAYGLNRRAADVHARTGRRPQVLLPFLGLLIVLPVIGFHLAGGGLAFEHPEFKGFNYRGGVSIYPEFVAVFLSLSIYTSSFIAEIVRSGILAVSHGQTEAALSLGLKRPKVLRLVVVPQAMRVIIPPLANQFLNLTKNSSLAAAIAYPDLVSVGGIMLNQSGQAIEIIMMWMLIYLSLSLFTSVVMNVWNKKAALIER